MPFSQFELHPRLQASLQKLNFEQLTPVQASLVPKALDGNDLLVSARTGSGKTLAFLVPTLQCILQQEPEVLRNGGTLAMVLVPTRELAQQMVKQCQQLISDTALRVTCLTGGDDFKHQASLLRKNPEIVVATPGRLLEHLSQGAPDLRQLLVLVIDEADRMLDMGFGEDVLEIATHCPRQRQTLLLSATLERKGLRGIGRQLLQQPELIETDPLRGQHNDIRQQIILADDRNHKERLLHWLLHNETRRKALVFCNTRLQADQLGRSFEASKLRSAVLHGEVPQSTRNRIMAHYRQGNTKVLLTTDLAARGLDIQGVDLVINFDMARSGDDYVHRIGRTGRAGEQGLAISLISALEWNLMASIERYLRVVFEHRQIVGLEAKYTGPKKLKSSGKAAGSKKKKTASEKAASETSNKTRGKQRLRDKKNKGKRRSPTTAPEVNTSTSDNSGWATLKKKTD
jgi:superfamily II DNA/RNA helicase